jgi:hypothetical protein
MRLPVPVQAVRRLVCGRKELRLCGGDALMALPDEMADQVCLLRVLARRAPGVGVGLAAVLPDGQPRAEVLDVLEDGGQRGVVGARGHRDHRPRVRVCLGYASSRLPPPCAGLRRIACSTALSCADDGGFPRLSPPSTRLAALLMRLGLTALRGSNPRSSVADQALTVCAPDVARDAHSLWPRWPEPSALRASR